ncbi:MAG: M23 family metallopeptidase [Candidatus Solibacter sp.]
MRTATAFILGFALGAFALAVTLWSTGHLAMTSAQATVLVPAAPPPSLTGSPPVLPAPPEPAPPGPKGEMPQFGQSVAAAPPLPSAKMPRYGQSVAAPQPAPGAPAPAPTPTPGAAPRLAMPIAGIDPATLHSNFSEVREGHAHEAIDIMSPRGTPVLAVVEGNVAKLFTSKPGGLTVYQFDNAQRWCYYYAHLDRYAAGIKEGTLLRKGDVLGYVGSTGNAAPEAPHLHFAVFQLGPEKHWWEGTAVDPLPFLK